MFLSRSIKDYLCPNKIMIKFNGEDFSHVSECRSEEVIHSKNCGVKITPPVYIEDHTMHFTPVLNVWC